MFEKFRKWINNRLRVGQKKSYAFDTKKIPDQKYIVIGEYQFQNLVVQGNQYNLEATLSE